MATGVIGVSLTYPLKLLTSLFYKSRVAYGKYLGIVYGNVSYSVVEIVAGGKPVVCGYGAVEGRLVFGFAQDSGRAKGAFGERHAKKIAELYALAIKNGAPIVGVFDSAGALVYDGAEALAAYGSFMKCASEASGVVPQIALIDGVCAGSAAVVASMFDFCVTVKDVSKLYVSAPATLGEKGAVASAEAQSEAEGFELVKKILDVIPHNNAEGAAGELIDDINRQITLDVENCNVGELLEELCDNGSYIRIYEKYAPSLCLAIASFGGVATGVVASDKNVKGGAIDVNAAKAAARLVSFCDAFGLPVLTLVDSVGVDAESAESAEYASDLAKLAMSYASSENAKLTVVLGKAYGAAFTLLGSKSVGADLAYALPSACISVLSPEASVAFVWNDKVGEKSREELEAEWREKCASAAEAADRGAIDDVIEASELRKRICAALLMLVCKAEGTPSRKHTATLL